MKKCKQCGRTLIDELFRPYQPRGAGLRKTTVGRNTVCLDCEKLNATVTRVWKAETRTEKEELLLTQAATYYETLVANGNEPIGAYAKHVLGGEVTKKSLVDNSLDMMKHTLPAATGGLSAEYDALLQLELTAEPDHYQAMLQTLLDKSLGANTKILPCYKEAFDAVARRFDDYEDNYVW